MAVNITFLGHAAFLLEADRHSVAIDPFLTGNPLATKQAADIHADHIVLTHGHADHVGDTISIAKSCDSVVYAAFEICEYLGGQGIDKCEPGNPGGKINTDFGWVAFTQAFHSSSFNGRYMGMPCGVVVHLGGVTIYHCGDTALFSDMKLIGELYRPDIACIPVGDRFTMGPEQGAMAAEFIKPKVAIPIHYKTWPLLVSDISGFKPRGVEVRTLESGQTWSYGQI